MDHAFLGIPNVTPLLFAGLSLASFCTAFIGVVAGTAGGLLLLTLLAMAFPPTMVIPIHTMVQLGIDSTRVMLMWRHVLKDTLLPFAIGAALGVAAGAQIFVMLSAGILQAILAVFVLFVTWMPHIGRVGGLRNRFAVLGAGAGFLGMFVGATGILVAPFVAHASPERRNHSATLGALMLLTHIAKIIAFGTLGVALGRQLPLVAAMVVTGSAGNWAGRETLARMKEHNFRFILQVLLTLLALRLVWAAATRMGWL